MFYKKIILMLQKKKKKQFQKIYFRLLKVYVVAKHEKIKTVKNKLRTKNF